MSYQTLIKKLLAMPGRKLQAFDAFQKLDQKLGSPHRSFKSIHIGGTNGKGSVALKIAESLRASGKKVGLYTSPHISCVRERIQVGGVMIPEEAILRHLPRLLNPGHSFFDILTALAFLYFKEEKVEWAVIEVGLGGRFDATNVIHPEIAVITSIGFDHMETLGNTLEQIAFEKRGIVKLGVPLVVGPNAAKFFSDGICVPAVAGFYDEENTAIAAAALKLLGINTVAAVRPKCRFEVVGNTIFDGAHNAQGFQRLVEALQIHFPKEKFRFVTHFSKDKDRESCLEVIRPLAAKTGRTVICGSFYHMAEARRALGIVEPHDPE